MEAVWKSRLRAKEPMTYRCHGDDNLGTVALEQVVREIAFWCRKVRLNCENNGQLICLFWVQCHWFTKNISSRKGVIFLFSGTFHDVTVIVTSFRSKRLTVTSGFCAPIEDAIFDYLKVNNVITFLAGGPGASSLVQTTFSEMQRAWWREWTGNDCFLRDNTRENGARGISNLDSRRLAGCYHIETTIRYALAAESSLVRRSHKWSSFSRTAWRFLFQ